jgi:methylated-DNA-[protein]-cysteine S-methyltransferase
MSRAYRYYDAPIPLGAQTVPMLLVATDDAICGLYFAGPQRKRELVPDATAIPDDGRSILADCARELDEYFAGTRTVFDVPVTLEGTPFQLTVWNELAKVGYGVTMSYGELARRAGLPKEAVRAVGSANGSNPVSIIIPCHRIIGADGSLTGYGGGLENKRMLLALESNEQTLL